MPPVLERRSTRMTVQPPDVPERFVSANIAAEFLSVTPRFLIEEARAGRLPGHPLGRGKRKQMALPVVGIVCRRGRPSPRKLMVYFCGRTR
jgi:hypothetical protein